MFARFHVRSLIMVVSGFILVYLSINAYGVNTIEKVNTISISLGLIVFIILGVLALLKWMPSFNKKALINTFGISVLIYLATIMFTLFYSEWAISLSNFLRVIMAAYLSFLFGIILYIQK